MATSACLFRELQKRMPGGTPFQLRTRLGLCLALPGWMFIVSGFLFHDHIDPPKAIVFQVLVCSQNGLHGSLFLLFIVSPQ